MSTNEFTFTLTVPFDIQESLSPNALILRGVFIRLNLPTRNGRVYAIEESEQIAKDLMGKPVYIHANIKGEHINTEPAKVGEIIDAIVDIPNKLIRGAIKVNNTQYYPDLISRITKGWGLSIGGKMEKYQFLGSLNERLMPIIKIIGMRANHIQLLEPTEKRGDLGASVSELIPVMESLQISPELTEVTEAELVKSMELVLNKITEVEKRISKVEENNKQKETKIEEKKQVIKNIVIEDAYVVDIIEQKKNIS